MKKKQDVEQEKVVETKKKGIVIAETEDDIILGGLKGDPDDFQEEVKKEAEKGKFLRTITPILVFLLLGVVVAYGTMYYKKQSDTEGPKKTEDKIQTPPTVEENEETVTESATTTPAPQTPAASAGYTEYTVVAGDTLSGIANAHDLTSTQLAQYNNISVETMLQIGQKLKIPTS